MKDSNLLEIKRYPVTSELLKPWVKFFWSIETAESVSIKHKLLPTDSIDLLLSANNKTAYETDGVFYDACNVHFCGMRHKYRLIIQEGVLRVFGISFFSYGLYPFVNEPLSGLCNGVVALKSCNARLAEKLEQIQLSNMNFLMMSQEITEVLESSLDINGINMQRIEQIRGFCQQNYSSSVGTFCQVKGVNQKSFERACRKYTGYTPKALKRIGRFQAVGNELIYNADRASFSELAYDYDFCDQAHFIREFQAHAGSPPKRFVQERLSVKENSKVTVVGK